MLIKTIATLFTCALIFVVAMSTVYKLIHVHDADALGALIVAGVCTVLMSGISISALLFLFTERE